MQIIDAEFTVVRQPRERRASLMVAAACFFGAAVALAAAAGFVTSDDAYWLIAGFAGLAIVSGLNLMGLQFSPVVLTLISAGGVAMIALLTGVLGAFWPVGSLVVGFVVLALSSADKLGRMWK